MLNVRIPMRWFTNRTSFMSGVMAVFVMKPTPPDFVRMSRFPRKTPLPSVLVECSSSALFVSQIPMISYLILFASWMRSVRRSSEHRDRALKVHTRKSVLLVR